MLVDRIGNDFFAPSVGDIVVFHPPAGASNQVCGDRNEKPGQACDPSAKQRLNYNDCWLDFDVSKTMRKGNNALAIKATARNSHVLAPLTVRHVDALVRYSAPAAN